MNILVTGGLGYIGSHTVVKLIQSGYTPIIVDNLYNSKKSILSRIASITGKRPVFYQIDVRDKTNLNTIFKEHSIDAVIHFAGLKAVGESVAKPLAYYDANVYGSICLAGAMQAHNVRNIIFSSSATVYGKENVPPYQENFPTGNITSPYGWTKYIVEQCLINQQTAQTNWSITLLRYFNPVGAHPSGLIGEDPQGVPNNLVPYISQVAIGKQDFVAVYGNDYPTADGTAIRDYIHIEDLAEAHIASLKKCNNPGIHIYNLGNGTASSVLDVIHAYSRICGQAIPYKIMPRRSGDIAALWSSVAKAKQELNWQTKYTLVDMVRDSWNWQKQNPNGYPKEG